MHEWKKNDHLNVEKKEHITEDMLLIFFYSSTTILPNHRMFCKTSII